MTRASAEPPLRPLGIVALVGLIVVGSVLSSGDPRGLASYLTYAVVGAFLVTRRPRNIIGWILLAIAFGWVANTSYPGVDLEALVRGDASLRDTVIAWLNGWSGRGVFLGFLALTVVFPSGHLSNGRGRRVDLALLAIGAGIFLVTPFAPTLTVDPTGSTVSIVIDNPVGLLPGPGEAWASLLELGDLAFIALLTVGAGRLLLRSRRSRGVERLQFRWLVAAFGSILAAIAFGLAATIVVGDDVGTAAWIPVTVAYSTIPVAIGVAVMRYRLYEIDRIVSRTIAYAIVVGLLAIVFGITVVVTSTVLAQAGQGRAIAVAASTLLVFALFQPVLGRAKRGVDRRFNRASYDLNQIAAGFSRRSRDEVDMQTLTDDLAATTTTAVAPTTLSIWLRTPSRDRVTDPTP